MARSSFVAAAWPSYGTQLTMWVRSATDQFSQRLVDAYNQSHKNHISLTIIPNDNYLTKVGAAAERPAIWSSPASGAPATSSRCSCRCRRG